MGCSLPAETSTGEDYAFPEVYVEGVTPSNEYVVEVNGSYLLLKTPVFENAKRFFGHIIYEDVLNFLDLIEATAKRSFLVIKKYSPPHMEGLLIEKNTKLCFIEVRGHYPIVYVSEGDGVDVGDKIAYIVTGKGEVRVVKSPCSGIVVLSVNITWERPEKYILVVVDRNDCRRVTIRKSS